MAGFVADPGTQQTQGVLPQITGALNKLGKKLGVTIYGLSGWRSPAHSVAVGGSANDPHTTGTAEDIAVNSQSRASAGSISEADLESVGLTRPFGGANEINHIQLLKRSTVIRGNNGGSSSVFGGTRPGGQNADGSGGSDPLQQYVGLLDTPRTAPPDTKNPFKWWLASFTSNWTAINSGSAAAGPTDASTPSGGKMYGQVSYDQVSAIGQSHGWTTAQINDWFDNLIPSESDGTITDTNPTSGAYGIAQGITGPSWYAAHGGNANTVVGQLIAQANYIAQRYGNPSAAWTFHKKNNWY